MNKLVLASHGNLSIGMKDSVCMLMGDPQERLETITLKIGDSVELLIDEVIKNVISNPHDTFILITDIFGGSINNTALRNLCYSNLYVVCGMNLGLVLELLSKTEDISFELINDAILQAMNGMKVFSQLTGIKSIEEEF